MRTIPKHIKAKLQSIENHQYSVKRIVAEVMGWAGLSFDDTDEENGWDWGMYVDMQGDPAYADRSESLLLDFMNKKAG